MPRAWLARRDAHKAPPYWLHAAAYLVYLGVRKLLERDAEDGAPATGRARLFRDGAVVAALNPKTALFFLAFLPQFVDPARGAVAVQVMALGLLFVAIGVVTDGTYAVAAGTAGAWLRARRPRRWLARLSGAVYIGLGTAAALTGSRPERAS